MNELFNEVDLLEILKILIPEGTNQGRGDENKGISIKNENGIITINGYYKMASDKNGELENTQTFDDTNTKRVVVEFKKDVDCLDDSIFVEALEKARGFIDVKRFDKLLNLEHYTEKEAQETLSFIDCFKHVVSASLRDRIQNLTETLERFQ